MTTPKPVTDFGAVEMLPISSVTPAPDNPRKITNRAIEVVAKSLTEFGWQQPLVVDKDHVIIVGHTRYAAARSLKLKTVPVLVADHLTPEQVKAYRIADNRTGDFTTWDFPELVNQLEDLAPDFSDVLALQDWQAIIGDFENATDGTLDVPDHIAPHLDPHGGFHVLVVFRDEETAVKHQQQIIDMDGVLDVRHKR